jgi:hypothetical protein
MRIGLRETKMSIEISVLSNKRLAAIEEWQRAIDAEGHPLTLSTDRSIASLSGFLPAQWDGRPGGFECTHDDARELMDAYSGVDFGQPWKYALTFRWGSNLIECLSAYVAAAAYARATDGVVFDPQENKVLAEQEAFHLTHSLKKDLPLMEQTLSDIAKKFTSRD